MPRTVSKENLWSVYILRCADGSLYTGIARSIEKRLDEHNHHAQKGAKYTRARRPVKLAYSESCHSRSAASKREAAIKALTKEQKEALVASGPRND